jgi:nicotinamidase-related amidase
MTKLLPLPPFFSPSHAARWGYAPDVPALFAHAQEHRREHAVAPAGADRVRTHLLVIDAQKDFCFPEGALYVAGRSGSGAVDDSARLASYIYRNLAELTGLTFTFDTHHALQLFFPSFWLLPDGSPPAPHRAVTALDLASGRLRVSPDVAAQVAGGDVAGLQARVLHYCRELERAGKYTLWLWPPHCLLGGEGHALAGVLQEARLFHAFCRTAQSHAAVKGEHPLSENYSVFSPEVLTDQHGAQVLQKDSALLDRLLSADRLIIAGEASSHCVKSSIEDLLAAIRARDARLARRVFLLTDCMSAVTVPDGKGGLAADFTPQAEEALARFAEAGMRLVTSAVPVCELPLP